MANDIDLWNDIEILQRDDELEESEFLAKIYRAKFIEGKDKEAENLKKEYTKKYGRWGNYF